MKKNKRFFINTAAGKTAVNLEKLKLCDGQGEPQHPNKNDVIVVGIIGPDTETLATLAILRSTTPLSFSYANSPIPEIKETIYYQPTQWPIPEYETEQMMKLLFPKVKITVEPPFKKIARDSAFKITCIEPIIQKIPKVLIRRRKI
jgi:hypothetical protein